MSKEVSSPRVKKTKSTGILESKQTVSQSKSERISGGLTHAKKKLKSLGTELRQRDEIDNTILDTIYVIDEVGREISLQVQPGPSGQTSLMTIKVNGTKIVENHEGAFAKAPLGIDKDLNGKVLRIVATIADTSDSTNETSLLISVNGGLIDAVFPLSKTLGGSGESADYMCRIEFFNP